jgi:hypothetical protein
MHKNKLSFLAFKQWSQTSNGKRPHQVLWAGSRAARGLITISVIPNCLNYRVIFIISTHTHTHTHTHTLYKCGHGSHNTTYRTACGPRVGTYTLTIVMLQWTWLTWSTVRRLGGHCKHNISETESVTITRYKGSYSVAPQKQPVSKLCTERGSDLRSHFWREITQHAQGNCTVTIQHIQETTTCKNNKTGETNNKFSNLYDDRAHWHNKEEWLKCTK